MTNGLVSLTVKGLTAGQSTNVTIKFDSLPGTTNRYLNFDPQLPNTSALGWYAFPNFTIGQNQITLHLTDNGIGDSNPTPGIIESIGGPGSAPPNQIPVANAGPDQPVRLGSLVTLNGSGSFDPDNGPSPLSFAWSKIAGPTVTLTGATTAKPTFTPNTAGGFTFSLMVKDGASDSAPDSVTITVPKLGDIDLDGDVDNNDLSRITSTLNKPANGPNDLRDINGDMKLDALDTRRLVLLCTKPRCAI